MPAEVAATEIDSVDELDDAAAFDRAAADESFESATPVELPELANNVHRGASTATDSDAPPVPTVDEIARKIPPSTRELLNELFRAEITRVSRISRDQLR